MFSYGDYGNNYQENDIGIKVRLMTGILPWMAVTKKSYSQESKDTQISNY